MPEPVRPAPTTAPRSRGRSPWSEWFPCAFGVPALGVSRWSISSSHPSPAAAVSWRVRLDLPQPPRRPVESPQGYGEQTGPSVRHELLGAEQVIAAGACDSPTGVVLPVRRKQLCVGQPRPSPDVPDACSGSASTTSLCGAARAPGSVEKSPRSLGAHLAHRCRSPPRHERGRSAVAFAMRFRRRPDAPHLGTLSAARHVARIRELAVRMYALIVPAAVPFVLLGTVMGLSWWEDHVLPPPKEPAEAPAEAPSTPAAPTALAQLPSSSATLTGVADRS